MNSTIRSSWLQKRTYYARLTTLLILALLISFIPVRAAQVDKPTPSACTAEAIMAARPLRVKDEFIHFFTVGSFPDSVPQNPVTMGVSDGTMDPRSEDEVKALMEEYVQAETPEIQARMWAVFNDPAAIAKISSPALRAALAGLVGTLGEPAIDYILHQTQNPDDPNSAPVITRVTYGTLDSSSVAEAHSDERVPGAAILVFNSRYNGENLFLLTSLMAHEPGHTDPDHNAYEEAILASIDSLVYLQQLVRHPQLARGANPDWPNGTELSQRLNTLAALRLNSGTSSQIGFTSSITGGTALPGGDSPLTRFWDLFLARAERGSAGYALVETPGNPVLQAYLAALGIPPGNYDYNEETLNLIDAAGNGPMTLMDLVRAAVALGLELPCSDYEVEALLQADEP